VQKIWCFPPYRQRFCHSPGKTPGLMNHRVRRVIYRSYAVGMQIRHVPGRTVRFAGSRMGRFFLLHKKSAHCANVLSKEGKSSARPEALSPAKRGSV
jgi:hypothetical protein